MAVRSSASAADHITFGLKKFVPLGLLMPPFKGFMMNIKPVKSV